jgi:ABC-type amino acid transport substrate-binding protein
LIVTFVVSHCRPALVAGLLALCSAWASAQAPAPLRVCVAADNPPLSHQASVKGKPSGPTSGLDVRIAQAWAQALGRALVLVPFESEFEKESTLAHEVAALLSAGVCDAASGFPLLPGDLGAPTRATSRTPDYPGAARKRDRPFVTLQAMAGSRAYLGAALGLVQRSDVTPTARLSDLGERKVGVVSGTLAGALMTTWHHGVLRKNMVSLSQRDDPLAELAAGDARRFDAVLMPLALFDGWRHQHPQAPLVAAGYQRPLGLHLGFVTLASQTELLASLNPLITQALADGRLAHWASEEGVSFIAPVMPEISRGPSLTELATD